MVTSVQELAERRSSTKKRGEVTHTLVYLVKTDDIHDGTAVAIEADGIAEIGEGWKGDTSIPVVSVDASPRQDSAKHFEVTIVWSSTQQAEQTDLHPLMRPPEYSWGASESTEPWFLDYSTPPKAFANTVGETFSGLSEREVSHPTISMSRNEDMFDQSWWSQWANTINRDLVMLDLTTYAPRTLRLSPVMASKVIELWQGSSVPYYKLNFNFAARHDEWMEEVEDRAFNELREVSRVIEGSSQTVKEWVPILDSAGRDLKYGWPLDGNGKRLPNVTDTPAKLSFQKYPAKAWAQLHLE